MPLTDNSTVLVIDDNPTNLEVLHHALTEVGYEVRVEIDGYNALNQIELQPPDLILLDVMLPDINGFEICQKLKANPCTQEIPIIFMTALINIEDKVTGLSLGAVDYITKPFQQEEVLARVSLHLKMRHLNKTLEIRNSQLQTEIEERQKTEMALHNLVSGTASLMGKDFFPAFVKHLAASLEVNYVFISEKKGEILETLAFWSVDRLSPNFTYKPEFTFTPCKIVLEQGRCFCFSKVREQFPQDIGLQELEVDSYLGIALLNSNQEPIGALCILHDDTIVNQPWFEKILRIFASRAAAELERMQAAQALQNLNQELEARVKKRTAELVQNQEYLRQLTENIDSVFWMTNLDKSQMIYVSPAYEKIWGFSIQELYRSPQQWIEAIHPDDREMVVAGLPQQIRGEYNEEYRIIRPDGKICWIQDRAFPIRDELGEVYRIAGFAEDISKQKQIEETLKLQGRAIAASSNGIVIVDARLPDLPTIFVNSAFEKITGYTAAEVIGHNCRFLQGEDCEQPGVFKLRTALKEGSGCTMSLRNYRKDGTLFWNELSVSPIYDEQGNLSHYIGIQTDITDRIKAERNLKQQSVAMEAAINGIAILDAQEQYIYVNHSHLQLFGYQDQQELLGKSWRHLYDRDELERFESEIWPILLRDGHWQGEAIAKRQDGSTFAEEISLTLIEGGGLVSVCRDITQRKQAEELLKSSLQEKEILLKEIHHRVKNNLLVVSSLLHWQNEYITDPAVSRIFQESQYRIHSMALIHEKLYNSKNLAEVNFTEYLETLAQQLYYSFNIATDRIQLNLELEPVSLNIETATPCGLIVSELIANVFEHAFPDNRKGELYLSLKNEQDRVILTIQDNGVGLPSDFDISQTESMGLQLIDMLSQQIKADLEVITDNGTTFNLIFAELKYRKRI
ncbi:PAS domain S-box protein [Dapis sp. BLCC M229]|uniref:PAS domain S-box protein n=1 Tax=Dapis sp. BLCC M229 TaxID=3400188 RepID=UPI003CECFE68